MEEISLRALAEHDIETRFRVRATRGDRERGLELLDELDRRHERSKEQGLPARTSGGAPNA